MTLPTTPRKPDCVQPGGGFCIGVELLWGRFRRWTLRTFRAGYVKAMCAKMKGDLTGCPIEVIDDRDLKFYRNVCTAHFAPEDDRFRWRNHLGFARYGFAEIILFSLVFTALANACVTGAVLLHWLFWIPLAGVMLVWLEILYFFRDPERPIPTDADALASPADGVVTNIEEVVEPDFPGGKALRISIFLSIFNVHVNRMPRAAKITDVRYFPGAYLDARNPDSAVRNEQLWIDAIDAVTNQPMRVKQISGAIARRIVCWLKPGDELVKGERLGMIKLGSRTDLLLPVDAVKEVCVKVGTKVLGGSTILLRMK